MIKDQTFNGETYWWDSDYDPNTGKLAYKETHYIGDILEQNAAQQKEANNGFTPDRTMRMIGRIPVALTMDPDYKALPEVGKQLFLRWFLEQHPECRTVDKLLHVGANDGHILIR